MSEFLLGAGIGWAAGLTPGPLHSLILQVAIRRGFRSGAVVAFAPPLADIPVIPLALLLVGTLATGALQILAILGGLFLVWLGIDGIRKADDEGDAAAVGSDLWKGIVTNLLNPHPWIFWLTVGAPILIAAWMRDPWRGLLFLAGFYGLMVSTKLVVAWIASQGRRLAGTPWYRRLLVMSGTLMIGLGLFLIWDATLGDLIA